MHYHAMHFHAMHYHGLIAAHLQTLSALIAFLIVAAALAGGLALRHARR